MTIDKENNNTEDTQRESFSKINRKRNILFALIDFFFVKKFNSNIISMAKWCDLKENKKIYLLTYNIINYLRDNKHSALELKILMLSMRYLEDDRKHFNLLLKTYTTKNLKINNIKSLISLRKELAKVSFIHASKHFNVSFIELLNILDTCIVNYLFSSIAFLFEDGSFNFLRLMFLLKTEKKFSQIDKCFLCIDEKNINFPCNEKIIYSIVLKEFRKYILKTHHLQDPNRIILAWIWLKVIRQYRSEVDVDELSFRLDLVHNIALLRRSRPDLSAETVVHSGPDASPVFPRFESGGMDCAGWSTPVGLQSNGRSPFEPSCLVMLDNAMFFGDTTLIWCHDAKWRLADTEELTSYNRSPGLLEVRSTSKRQREIGRLDDITAIDTSREHAHSRSGRFFLASVVNFGANFGHFIYQTLPNISFYQTHIHDGRRIVLNGEPKDFQRAYLSMLGINIDEISYLGSDQVLEGDLAYFRESFGPQVNFVRVQALRQRVAVLELARPSPFGQRVYLSRQVAAARRTANEEEVQELLRSFGFDIVVPDGRTAEEQIAILENANIVVAPHGSALTNLIFCQQSKLVIEGHSKTKPDQTTFMHMLGHKVYWTEMKPRIVNNGNIEYFWNISDLKSLLNKIFNT